MRWFVLFLIFIYSYALNFTQKEKKYIDSQVFKVVTTSTWEPFNTKINGELVGISVDYWKLIAKRAGIKYEFILKPTWLDVLESVKEHRADLSLGAGKTKEREKYAVFTKPFVSFPLVIATKNDVGFIPDVTFLHDKPIAVGRGYTAEALLKKKYPHLNIISVDTIDKALELVKEGKVYAAIDILPVIAYKINKYQFKNLKISGQLDINFPVRFMVSKQDSNLVNVLNKTIDTITYKDRENIYEKWIKAKDTRDNYFYVAIILGGVIVILVIWVIYLTRKLQQERDYEKLLKNVAYIDKLTGIGNQKKLLEDIEKLINKNVSFCSLFLEIQNFPEIKNRFGHQVGDIVLVEFSSLIQGIVSKGMIFGRWESDEFIILIPQCNEKKACEFAWNLKEKVEKYNFGISIPLKLEFGLVKHEGEPVEEFIEKIRKKSVSGC